LKVLLIDDDLAIHQLMRKFINPLITLECLTGLPADSRKFSDFDLIILDLWLEQDKNSLKFLNNIQETSPYLLDKVILLTGSGSEETEVETHKLGVRDYVKKPVNPRVFSALIDKHLKSLNKGTSELRFGPFRLDLANYEAYVEGENGKLDLSNTEFKVLKMMMESRGRIVTRERLMTEVWEMNDEIQTRTVDMHISTLRKKLKTASDLLKTKRGVGYFLSEK
jgi:DNA-binding response OmpR family regulator